MIEEWCDTLRREKPGEISEAICYSLSGSGKRLRPVLALAAYQELGGEGDAAELATAVEVVHSYSLVHDDLPCMDDDDLRRGRPTTHRKFSVPVAVEAAYKMVPLAGRLLASGAARLGLDVAVLGRIGRELFHAAGASGMIGGQVLDLEAEDHRTSAEELIDIHRRKTGALIAASGVIGGLAAGATDDEVEAVRNYGQEVGLGFQIVDDILDATSTSKQLGKTAGKDRMQHKATFVTVLGLERARLEARARIGEAIDQLGRAGINSKLLAGLATYVLDRQS